MKKWRINDLISIWENRFDSIELKGVCPVCDNRNWLMEFDEYSLNISDPNHFWVVSKIVNSGNEHDNSIENMHPIHKKCIRRI